MVQKVYGQANGFEVLLQRETNGTWTAELPSNEDGEYVIELYAQDEAGNSAYLCKTLFVILGHRLHIKILETGFAGNFKEHLNQVQLQEKTYALQMRTRGYQTEVCRNEHTIQIKKEGHKIEYIVCCGNKNGFR